MSSKVTKIYYTFSRLTTIIRQKRSDFLEGTSSVALFCRKAMPAQENKLYPGWLEDLQISLEAQAVAGIRRAG